MEGALHFLLLSDQPWSFDGNPHVDLHFLLVGLGVVGLEVVPDPVDVLALLTDDHALHVLVLHHHSELQEVAPVGFRGDRLAFYDHVVRHVVVQPMEKRFF